MNDDSHFLLSLSVDLSTRGNEYYGRRCKEIADEIERLRTTLRDISGYTRDPVVQGMAAGALRASEQSAPKGPAGHKGQVGWMGGEYDR